MPEAPESIGPYKVLSKVGEGAMGIVYKAQDKRLDRVIALKVIREFQSDPGRRRRFWQEARAAAQVSHPNACQLYDLGEDNQEASRSFVDLGGDSILGIQAESY